MSFKIDTIRNFEKELKRLGKKHRSIPKDYENLLDSLEKDPFQGTHIKENCYKIRMAITSKGRGKSGGARVITYVAVVDEIVYLLSIFEKSEKANLTDKELEDLIAEIPT